MGSDPSRNLHDTERGRGAKPTPASSLASAMSLDAQRLRLRWDGMAFFVIRFGGVGAWSAASALALCLVAGGEYAAAKPNTGSAGAPNVARERKKAPKVDAHLGERPPGRIERERKRKEAAGGDKKRRKRGEPESLPSDVPPINVPPGYGRYCSLLFPDGKSQLSMLPDTRSNACAVAAPSKPTIQRAGVWSVQGSNNVLVRCGKEISLYKDNGIAALTAATRWAKDRQGCVFVVSPAELPLFGRPYGKRTPDQANPDDGVSHYSGFDVARFTTRLDVTPFGQPANASENPALIVDHRGRWQNPQLALDNHDGQDLAMPLGTPILAVAAGAVRAARWREVGCDDPQQSEIYIEHLLDGGPFEERFVTYYAHMDTMTVREGQRVARGDVIGTSGTRGCSGGPHLHFSVSRLTNLTGKRRHAFEPLLDGHGDNAFGSRIDPYGWAAPKGVDPWAWMYIGSYQDEYGETFVDPGAFSINLWLPGEAPPTPNW